MSNQLIKTENKGLQNNLRDKMENFEVTYKHAHPIACIFMQIANIRRDLPIIMNALLIGDTDESRKQEIEELIQNNIYLGGLQTIQTWIAWKSREAKFNDLIRITRKINKNLGDTLEEKADEIREPQ